MVSGRLRSEAAAWAAICLIRCSSRLDGDVLRTGRRPDGIQPRHAPGRPSVNQTQRPCQGGVTGPTAGLTASTGFGSVVPRNLRANAGGLAPCNPKRTTGRSSCGQRVRGNFPRPSPRPTRPRLASRNPRPRGDQALFPPEVEPGVSLDHLIGAVYPGVRGHTSSSGHWLSDEPRRPRPPSGPVRAIGQFGRFLPAHPARRLNFRPPSRGGTGCGEPGSGRSGLRPPV